MKRRGAFRYASATRRSHDPTEEEGVMNDSTRVIRRPRRAPPFSERAAAAVIATAGLAVLAAACSGSGSSAGSDGSRHGQQTVRAFSQCMRSDGVPKFPDPVDEVDLPKIFPKGLGVSSSQFNAAETACQHLLPPTGDISGSSRGISASVERCVVGGVCTRAVTHWVAEQGAGVRPVHALAWADQLAGPDHRCPGAPEFRGAAGVGRLPARAAERHVRAPDRRAHPITVSS